MYKFLWSLFAFFFLSAVAWGQDVSFIFEGSGPPRVSPETKRIFDAGLDYLAATQADDGTWDGRLRIGGYGGGVDPQGAGATNGETALSLMCFLASGQDPNFGRYSINVRRAVRALLLAQNPTSGYIGKNMYEHGFAMLALSEAYGVVDERMVWAGYQGEYAGDMRPTIGRALELAVGCAMTGQEGNPFNAWTYGPHNERNHEGTRADTSVSGAVLMGLLGARNAGIPVPDRPIDLALDYFRSMTADGKTIYSASMQWATPETRSAICALVLTIGQRTHWKEFTQIPGFISENLEFEDPQHPFYSRYYMAQALLQVDLESWSAWHGNTRALINEMQQADGSIVPASKKGFTGQYQTPAYTTSMSLLALALEYRLLPIYERWPD